MQTHTFLPDTVFMLVWHKVPLNISHHVSLLTYSFLQHKKQSKEEWGMQRKEGKTEEKNRVNQVTLAIRCLAACPGLE